MIAGLEDITRARMLGTSGDPDNSGKVPDSSKERRPVGGNARRGAR
jgi:hypothetical protein